MCAKTNMAPLRLIYLLFVYINTRNGLVLAFYNESFNDTKIINGTLPVEISYATCKIVSADVETTANATITRQLSGVCSAKEVEEQIRLVETRLIYQIKELAESVSKLTGIGGAHRMLKSGEVKQLLGPSPVLKFEISTLNNTILDNGMRVFAYYWKVENINLLLTEQNVVFIESSAFIVSGLTHRIRLYLHHIGTSSLYLQILTGRPRYCIHQFTLLDQLTTDYHISSKLFKGYCPLGKETNQGECSGFKFSHSLLNSHNYLYNNLIVIKVNIYLE